MSMLAMMTTMAIKSGGDDDGNDGDDGNDDDDNHDGGLNFCPQLSEWSDL